jgi:hypothetical protein
MTTCPACAAWEADTRTGQYRTGCDDCTARDIARGYDYWRATVLGEKEALQAAIARSFADAEAGKRLVWGWAKRAGARE